MQTRTNQSLWQRIAISMNRIVDSIVQTMAALLLRITSSGRHRPARSNQLENIFSAGDHAMLEEVPAAIAMSLILRYRASGLDPLDSADVRHDSEQESKVDDPEEKTPPPAAYLNAETFLYQVPVSEIEEENKIVLDGFVFDTSEIVANVKQDLCKLYKNPHRIGRPGYNFSSSAVDDIRRHEHLKEFAARLDAMLLTQKDNILPASVDAVIIMLNSIAESIVENADIEILENKRKIMLATIVFYEHVKTLSAEQRQHLNQFVIEIPVATGDSRCMSFSSAMAIECVLTLEIYLWQFLYMTRPDAIREVPMRVKDNAISKGYGPKRTESRPRDTFRNFPPGRSFPLNLHTHFFHVVIPSGVMPTHILFGSNLSSADDDGPLFSHDYMDSHPAENHPDNVPPSHNEFDRNVSSSDDNSPISSDDDRDSHAAENYPGNVPHPSFRVMPPVNTVSSEEVRVEPSASRAFESASSENSRDLARDLARAFADGPLMMTASGGAASDPEPASDVHPASIGNAGGPVIPAAAERLLYQISQMHVQGLAIRETLRRLSLFLPAVDSVEQPAASHWPSANEDVEDSENANRSSSRPG